MQYVHCKCLVLLVIGGPVCCSGCATPSRRHRTKAEYYASRIEDACAFLVGRGSELHYVDVFAARDGELDSMDALAALGEDSLPGLMRLLRNPDNSIKCRAFNVVDMISCRLGVRQLHRTETLPGRCACHTARV